MTVAEPLSASPTPTRLTPTLQGRAVEVLQGDGGAASSLSVALLTPIFVVLSFAAFQAALWSHARTEARTVARDTAAQVARSGVAPDDAAVAARSVLGADTSLTDVDVSIVHSDGTVVVTIGGEAPGIIRGTSRAVSVTVAVPTEELTPP